MIILPILSTSRIHSLFRKLGKCTFWAQEWKGTSKLSQETQYLASILSDTISLSRMKREFCVDVNSVRPMTEFARAFPQLCFFFFRRTIAGKTASTKKSHVGLEKGVRCLSSLTFIIWINPFTPKSDQFQIPPAASPAILHPTVRRTWLFIAYFHYLTYIFSFNPSTPKFKTYILPTFLNINV